MALIVFGIFILMSIVLALRAKAGGTSKSVHDFFVASGQFGSRLLFVLAAGEIYSIGTMVGFPGGIYAKGATYGVWFIGYILLAYPIGYFIGPKLWAVGKQLGSITMPDLVRGYFSSRPAELVVAVTSIIFMLPAGQLQFVGLVMALRALGLEFNPVWLVVFAAFLAFIYIIIAGVRASAYVSIQKDILMILAIVITGVAVAVETGVGPVFAAASSSTNTAFTSNQLNFAMSTIVFQALGFYCVPFSVQNFFTAKSADTIRRSQICMPLYMLMFPFLVLASYYALSQNLHLSSPNEAFFAAVTGLLPSWLVGLVAAAASLAGLMSLAGICLAIGPIVSRNIIPNMPESRQKGAAKIVICAYLLLSIVMALKAPNLMVTLINMTYYGITQFAPLILAIVFGLRLQGRAVAAGVLAGQGFALVLYYMSPDLNGINLGLVALALNLVVTAVVHLASSSKRARLPA
ncbi:sodium:solute symporter family protein [Paraburkholderia bannensis]|uniref:sodium:solute symporter family protein n=1 Tax=Paraburkholderia bannensis TaxID=765414 RepID=UPI002ABE0799|nr:sodium:solute symporter family protein [Paraburkholderia bannensis]